ncbi:MAG TPA: diguanylate cyclase [Gemmatimonadales bacterium]|nr:diguanylate cyclase [Gemmatimonadales bacterium]
MASWEQSSAKLLRALRLDSIRSKLLVFGILATLIPSLSSAWVSYTENERSLTAKIAGELTSVSAQTAREMNLWVKERFYDLDVFAGSYEVTENLDRIQRAGGGSRASDVAHRRLTDYLNSVRERFADYAELLVLDPAGRIVATTAKQGRDVRLPPDWLKELRERNALLGDAYGDDVARAGVVVFAVPIYVTRGRLLGALTAKVRLRAVRDVLGRFASGAAADVSLLTPDGHLIAGTRADTARFLAPVLGDRTLHQLAARDGIAVDYRGVEGDATVGTLKQVPSLPWTVLAAVPALEAYGQIRHLRNVTLLIVAALLVGVGLLGYVLGLLITRPLDRLTEGAAKVAAGDLAVDLPVVGGGELGSLTEVFNDMVTRLRGGRRELERLSATDDLTGLYNRRHLTDILASEVRRSRRLGHSFALFMADVDHFKEYNDTHGHLAGDAALTCVAGILRECTRDVDCAARYGGEEFVVLLPETDAAGGIEIAERIRARLAADELIVGQLTLSVGVTEFPDGGDTPEALIASADAALYEAKHQGRDRVVRAGSHPIARRREG